MSVAASVAPREAPARRAAAFPAEWIARPLLYDLPELKSAHDALWRAMRERVPNFAAAPEDLARAAGGGWEDVLFAQVCGYRYATQLTDRTAIVATPRYKVKGADGPFVRSGLLVRLRDPANGPADLRGRSLAFDADDLNSVNLLRAEIAPLARNGRFFGALQPAGSFVEAAEAVAEGETDAALLDGVAYALLERLRPNLANRLRLLLWTTRSPGPPIVASQAIGADTVLALGRALTDIAADSAFGWLRSDLLIAGFNPLPKSQYRAVAHLEQIAESQGYPTLA